jgi:hypothetical protein
MGWAGYNTSTEEGSTLDQLHIFHSSGYISRFAWEPFYIGRQSDPPFDERIFREYALNKVIQANALCHLRYRFHVLADAFLVHKPGVRVGASFKNYGLKGIGKRIINSRAKPLQKVLYGRNWKCT